MLVITALVGTRDLGQEVYIALAKADTGRGIVAGLAIAFIAIIADRLITAGARAACGCGSALHERRDVDDRRTGRHDGLPAHAAVVVIGGGIIGCSTAYHLARDHKADVVLIEQGKLTGGSTWHAAGLVGQLRSSASITQVLRYSVDLYKRLEAETGLATGWRETGCLRLACNEDRWTEFKRQATTARSFGLDMHLLSPAEVKALWPLMEVDDLVGATFMPTRRAGEPSDITQSLAKGARMHGAKLHRGRRLHRLR